MAFFNHLLLLAHLLLLTVGSAEEPIYYNCDKPFAGNGTLASYITDVLTKIKALSSLNGYALSQDTGDGLNQVSGLAQCQGGLTAAVCSACVDQAVNDLTKYCPGKLEVSIWYPSCYLRISGEDFLGRIVKGGEILLRSTQEAPNPVAFGLAVEEELSRLKKEVRASGSRLFGTAETNVPANHRKHGALKVFGMAQCTHDLRASTCFVCLNRLYDRIMANCSTRIGCSVLHTSCYVRLGIHEV
ncbi:Cysteine-rich repeat secretory protein 38 [Apostasia shenzhenica]|uniref:Cysteine-rich repeat secretory protein 38 n=1 Tax=Apostasia shenzhenica TaxID=1088818 RepID=A0A2I0A4V8_9ASPA|nr:Cysteine-rich repeat secretory protein 38 [Apostasia shenzhenica]